MSWSAASRARVGAAVFQRYAAPVLAFPEQHHPLRVARVAAGLTQLELGAASHLRGELVSRIERRVIPGSPAAHLALSDALGMSVGQLFPC
jgi:hypothetical protein